MLFPQYDRAKEQKKITFDFPSDEPNAHFLIRMDINR